MSGVNWTVLGVGVSDETVIGDGCGFGGGGNGAKPGGVEEFVVFENISASCSSACL